MGDSSRAERRCREAWGGAQRHRVKRCFCWERSFEQTEMLSRSNESALELCFTVESRSAKQSLRFAHECTFNRKLRDGRRR